MAEKRKLQAEIDRCMKKVDEGIDDFDSIWQKVQEATNAGQKEKFESDLKKEIKKLQRLRDQIKTWISSNEIKDKQKLLDTRKRIETKMEQFKVVERETKMKAFSKTGLNSEQKMDPREREREEVVGWIQDCLDRLQQQCDHCEAEIEQLQAQTGKRKKLDKEKGDKIEEWKARIERHRFHISRLELIMRLLVNNTLDCDQVRDVKELVDDYVERNTEPDFEEVEIYEDLHLDVAELNQQLGNVAPLSGLDEHESETATTNSNTSPSISPGPPSLPASKESSIDADQRVRGVSQSDETKPQVTRTNSISRSTPNTPLRTQSSQESTSASQVSRALSSPPPPAAPPTPPGVPYNSVAAGTTRAQSAARIAQQSPLKLEDQVTSVQMIADQLTIPKRSSTPPTVGVIGVSNLMTSVTPGFAQVVTPATVASSTPVSLPLMSPTTTTPPPLHHMQQPVQSLPTGLMGMGSPVLESMSLMSQPVLNGPTSSLVAEQDSGLSSLKDLAQQALTPFQTQPRQQQPHQQSLLPQSLQSGFLPNLGGLDQVGGFSLSAFGNASLLHQQQQMQDVKIPPLLGASPLGPKPFQSDEQTAVQMMEAMLRNLPLPSDSEKSRQYFPRTPCNICPAYYPKTAPPGCENVDFFSRLAPETLFFVFYYCEGTRAQLLAAKALKKQSWRFHTKYMMWFQRHEEPKVITDEYEQGTYIYFDFEKWAQRKKEGFTFEYKYLEDRDLG